MSDNIITESKSVLDGIYTTEVLHADEVPATIKAYESIEISEEKIIYEEIPGYATLDDGTPSAATVLNNMIASINGLDLISTLVNRVGDNLLKYQDADGEPDLLKIPDALYQVAITHEVKDIASRNKWKIARSEAGVVYLYNKYN